MTETRRIIERDERGLISGIVDLIDGEVDPDRTVEIERDVDGRLVSLLETTAPVEPVATAEDLERVEQELATTKQRAAEVVSLLDRRSSKLEATVDELTTPPPPPTREEFDERFQRLSLRLGRRRDGSPLHVALATAAATIGTGDLARAVQVLRGAEDQP